MQKNTKVKVSENAPHHAGREGYFLFFHHRTEDNDGMLLAEPELIAVMTAEPNDVVRPCETLFAVNRRFVVPV